MTSPAPEPARPPLDELLRLRRLRRREIAPRLHWKILDRVKPERDPRDREFLPSALAIVEAPPTPHAMWLLYAICALITVALAWSWFGHLDVYADASGKIQPSGRTKTIQPLVTGKVIRIAVKDGDHVKAGDVLLELDPTNALAGQRIASDNLVNAEAEIIRRKAAVAALNGHSVNLSPKLVWSATIPESVRNREQQALRAALTNLSAALDSLDAQRKQKEAERDSYSKSIAAQKAVIEVISDQVGMVRTLNDKGWNSRAQYLSKILVQRQAELTLAGLEGSVSQAEAAIPVIVANIQKTRQTFLEGNTDRLVQLQRQVESDRETLAKATALVGQMTLTAPIAGTIAASTVTTVGQVVSTGQQLMQLVPSSGGGLEIEAYVLNTDIGFVRKGQEAIVQVDAFPFTRYGTIGGVVRSIARDAIPGSEAARQMKNPSQPLPSSGLLAATSAAQQTQDLVFPTLISLERPEIVIDGKSVPLVPGMTVSVEIKTESRRAIDYLLSPLQAAVTSAGHER